VTVVQVSNSRIDSDTTAATLACALYCLAANPVEAGKLRSEIKSLVSPGSEYTSRDIQDGQHLNGVINETLRLYHPVPSGLLRVTPPEGITVAETFIPGNTTVYVPYYSMGRRE
jgi:tryprostatin B 6-hydroxylase